MVVANNQINDNKKCRQIAGNFDGHTDVVVQWGLHHPIAHIQGFTQSHWMLISSKCPHCIAPVAAKVINFGCKHKTPNKTKLLAD
jgi:hypothetical protein